MISDTMKTLTNRFIVIFGLLPVVFLPLTQDYYELNKWMLLTVTAIILVVIWSVLSYKKRETQFYLPPICLGLIVLLISMIVSLVATSTNKVEALMAPIGPISIASLLILASLIPPMDDKRRKFLQTFLLCVVGFLGLVSIYQYIGIAGMMFPRATFLTDKLWSPTGGPLATLAITIILLPLLIQSLIRAIKAKHESTIALYVVISLITLIGTGLLLFSLIPKFSRVAMSPLDGWAVTLETLKTAKGAMFGIGTENFITSQTLGRSPSINMTPLWNTRFNTNANFLFHQIAVNGLLGGFATLVFLGSIVWSFVTALKTGRKMTAIHGSLILGVFMLLSLPPTITTIATIVALALLSTTDHEGIKTVRIPLHALWVRISFLVCCLLIALSSLYMITRAYGAELAYYQSFVAAAKNDGTKVYNLQIKAISRNPLVPRFHIGYSQTCLALASSIAKTISENLDQPTPPTSETMDKDKNLATQLIQQSIRDAKIAINLNPISILGWENLARVYMNLANIAQGADSWAVASYQKAIQLDPTNPLLRVELAGVYLGQAKYDQAIGELNNAIALKSDYANAYYNLANVYVKQGNEVNAASALEKTIKLLEPGSIDYEKAQTMLNQLKNGTLQKPSPTPPPITLPKE
jgi:cytochrome c-type biogenesis protein CcmH/NrfG